MMKKIENKKLRSIIRFILLFTGYMLIPSLVYTLLANSKIFANDLLMQVIANSVYILILAIIYRRKILGVITDYKKNFAKYLGIIFKWWAIGLAIMMASNLVLNTFVFDNIASNEQMARDMLLSSPILGLISASILAPIAEELIFRYSYKEAFKNKYIYCFISFLLFGLIHAISGLTTALELLYIIPYGALGFAFAKIYSDTDNILTSITAHVIHNTLTFVLLLIV